MDSNIVKPNNEKTKITKKPRNKQPKEPKQPRQPRQPKELQNHVAASNTTDSTRIDIKNCDGLEYLETIENGTIDLILTDPPYIISRDSGMNAHYETVKQNESEGVEFVKTQVEWDEYVASHHDLATATEEQRNNYLRYGTIYGKKYCVRTQYGNWDENFTMEMLERFIKAYYQKLKKGGTLIIWFDLWKITELKNLLEKHKFKQLRFIEWIKTNPQPLNSATNYLTNCREIALVCVKDGKPTFNSKYDNGIYQYPLQGGKNRFHPTQKSLVLFEELIKKHSNDNAIVMDTFLGGGTTALACVNTNRQFKGCEISKEYYDKIIAIINPDTNTNIDSNIDSNMDNTLLTNTSVLGNTLLTNTVLDATNASEKEVSSA
jgi:site-specific DNA-methyltransferase (adenine-specific)